MGTEYSAAVCFCVFVFLLEGVEGHWFDDIGRPFRTKVLLLLAIDPNVSNSVYLKLSDL